MNVWACKIRPLHLPLSAYETLNLSICWMTQPLQIEILREVCTSRGGIFYANLHKKYSAKNSFFNKILRFHPKIMKPSAYWTRKINFDFNKSSTHLGVTVPLKNSCRKSCAIAKIHARSGEISHTAPRNRDFPQNLRNTAKLMFNIRNTHVTPARSKNIFWG